MSRLIDILNKQRQPDVQPMGFLASKPKTGKVKMLLAAEIAAEKWEALGEGLKSADAIVVGLSKTDDLNPLEKADGGKEGPAAGGWLKISTAGVVKKALNLECDFLIFGSTAPVSLTRKEKTGRILEIDTDHADGLLRAIGELPVDAVLASGKATGMTLNINRLMYIQRLLMLINKPLILAIPDNLNQGELQTLWDIGVGAVMIEVNDEKDVQSLNEMRTIIDQLEIPAFRKKSKAMAILPRTAPAAAVPPERHEEEEEEDE